MHPHPEGFRERPTVLEEPEDPPQDPRVGQVIAGCVVKRKLGEGGMGAVYLAHHELLGVDVVVKVMKALLKRQPRRVERFLLEARAAAKIDHPNVVRVHHLGTDEDGLPFIVMQYVEGTNLDQRIKAVGAHDPTQATRIILDVARALAALHGAGIIHRDVKAENVVLAASGEVKLIDFGLVKDLTEDLNLTRQGALIGTPAYIAPEVGRVPDIDGRADIYSLGLTYYYLLTGKSPFAGWEVNDVIFGRARLRAPDALNPKVVAVHRRVLARMIARARERRYPDVPAVIGDLQALLSGDPVEAPVEPEDTWAAADVVSRGRRGSFRRKGGAARRPSARLEAAAPAGAVEPPVEPVVVSAATALPSAVSAALRDPTRRVGKYVLLEVLDTAGPGVLHRAWDLPRGARVLVRVVDGVRRLEPDAERTLQAVRRLRHPAIAPVLDHGVSDGRLFVALAAESGRALAELPQPVALRALQGLAAALAYAHQQQVVHGALTPASLIVDARGDPLLVDLGVAVAEPPDRLRARLERAGPAGPPGAAGDLHAFGLLLARVAATDATPRADLLALCRRCLATDPAGRYASAADVARDLDRLLHAQDARPGDQVPKQAVFAAAIVVAVMVGLVIGLAMS